MQHFLGPADNVCRQTGQARDLDPVGMTGPTLDDAPQENDLVVPLLNRNVVVLYPFTGQRKICQLMVVGRKERLGRDLGIVMQIFSHCPGDTDTVERRCPTAYLIKHDQAARGGMVEYIGGLCHLNHESRLATGQVVARPDPGENSIDNPDPCLSCRHQAAHLRHQDQQRDLPHERRLAGHIGSGNDQNLPFLGVHVDIIGNETLTQVHRLNNRMAPVLDKQVGRFVHLGAAIIPLMGQVCQAKQDIQDRNLVGCGLNALALRRNLSPDFLKKVVFDLDNPVFGTQHLFFIFFKSRSYVAFGIGQGLLALVIFRHTVQLGSGHFDVISEDPVVANLEIRDPGFFLLLLLQSGDPTLTFPADAAQLIQLAVVTLPDQTAFTQNKRRVVDN